jgi:predicted NAD-dependent protein-ADP-ribosyltransferase YbiA (DUF1768 family)
METLQVITFTKVSLPYGWLGNMSPYPIVFGKDTYKTSEALFQALRFSDRDIQKLIRDEKSPMGAKEIMNQNSEHLIVTKHSEIDINNMLMCLKLKVKQHPQLLTELLATGDMEIIEDVTKRGDVGGNLFWGAMLVDGEWVGKNMLGWLWMELRENYNSVGS